jgi:hypothetical protein
LRVPGVVLEVYFLAGAVPTEASSCFVALFEYTMISLWPLE